MENMAYCRWENTLAALQECQDSLTDDLAGIESVSRMAVVATAAEMLERLGVSVDRAALGAAMIRIGGAGYCG